MDLKALAEAVAAVDAVPMNDYGSQREWEEAKAKLRAAAWPEVKRLVAELSASYAVLDAMPDIGPVTLAPVEAAPVVEPSPVETSDLRAAWVGVTAAEALPTPPQRPAAKPRKGK